MIRRRVTKRGTRWDARLRDPAGRIYGRTFATRKEAERWERSELASRDKGDWIDPRARARTFGEVAAEWLASNPGKRASTIARDGAALRKYLLPALCDRKVGSIVPRDVQAVVTAMGEAGLAGSTVVRNTNVMGAVFQYATDRDYISKSPMRTVKRPKGRSGEGHDLDAEGAAAAGRRPPGRVRADGVAGGGARVAVG